MASLSGPRVMVIAVRFPSPIQPWLLNQVVQVYRRGGSVRIVATRPEGTSHAAVIDELDLLTSTHYVRLSSPVHTLRQASHLLLPTAQGRLARAGLRRLFASDWRPSTTRAWIKTLASSPVIELADVDLLHAHSLRFAYDYLHVAHIRGVPLVLTFHGHTAAGTGMLAQDKRERLFAAVAVALVNTDFARAQLIAIGCPREKIRLLPQGIRLADFEYRPQPFPESGPVRLLSVSRLQRDKGLRFAIQAVDRLLTEGYAVEYTLVGGGPEEAELRELVERLGRSRQIRLTGRVDDVTLRDLYRDAHVFVLPSLSNESDDHTETQGVAIQEAQASGAIVCASRVGGIPECVEDGTSAFLFPDRDPEAIAKVVAGIIDHPERWREWQDRGRVWVEERFDIDRLGDRLVDIYHGAIAQCEEGPVGP